MLKKFICLLVLTLAVGCAAKSRSSSPEEMLAEIAASRWEIDIAASMKVASLTRNRIESIGWDDFIYSYGQRGFRINMQTQEFTWYQWREGAAETVSFVVAPEIAEDVEMRERGVRQTQLILDDYNDTYVGLRYNADGKLACFVNNKLLGIFSPWKE